MIRFTSGTYQASNTASRMNLSIKIVLYVRKGWGNKFLEFGNKRMYGCGNITFSKTPKNGTEFICATSLVTNLLTIIVILGIEI